MQMGTVAQTTARLGPPIDIRNFGTAITTDDRDYLRRKLAARLTRFVDRVKRASARIEDVNGRRGGIDKRCRIKVVLSGVPSVTVEEQQAVLRAAIDGALRRIATAVKRAVARRQGPVPHGSRIARALIERDERAES